MRVIDLRSDTVSHPSDAMRDAMAAAVVGDDGFADDPTVKQLEALAARKLGKEAALFVASGTQGNLVSLLTHADRGSEAIVGEQSHIVLAEVAGAATLGRIQLRTVPNGPRGELDPARVRALVRPENVHFPVTAVVCVENTHNRCNGAALSRAEMASVAEVARDTGLRFHIDGARIFNAAVAQGVPVAQIARHGDSIGFCVSKGLSAPFGSVLCGSADFIERARAFRRMVGGGMRQAGVVAAAGIVALERMIDRLAEDHRRAKRLAEGLHAIDPRLSDPKLVETNIVMVEISHTGSDAKSWMAALDRAGLKSGAWNRKSIRLVTHRHIDDAAVEEALAIIRTVSAALVRPEGKVLEKAI